MRSLLFKIYCFSLFITISFANELPIKNYSEAACKVLGLKPIILPSGEKIMPQHDGKHFFVDEKNSQQTAGDVTPEQVKEIIAKAKNVGQKVYDLLSMQYASSLPIIIQKEIAGTTYDIALDKLAFTPNGNTITIMAMITTPDGNSLCFAGEQIGFTGQGGIKEGTLRLILGGNNKIKLFKIEKVELELTEGALKFGCNGYESFSIGGNVIFDRSLIVPDDIKTGEPAAGNVSSRFLLEDVRDWNDMLIEISMQPFQIPSMKGYGFSVTNAVIDISDHVNSPLCQFPKGYTNAEMDELWRGVYIGNVTVRFPLYFKNRTSKQRISVGVNSLLIDKIGVSGEIFGENIMTIKDGDLSGWDYSIDGASIFLVKNKVKAGSLIGKMRVSISSEEKLLAYKAIIDPTREYYNFSVTAVDSLDFEVFKAANVHLEPVSTVGLTLENGEFSASAMLHGRMNILSVKEGVSLEEFNFQNLFLSTKAPYLSVGYFGGGSDKEHQLGGFPISIVSPKVLIQNNVADISFGVKVNLDDMGITAIGGFVIQGAFVNENNRHFWKNKKFAITKLHVEADLKAASFKGDVEFFNDDPIYGKGFYGQMQMDLDVGNIGVGAVALFGKKEKRYWFVDGELSSGGSGNGLSITVLAGSLYKHMAPVPGSNGPKSLSGVVYAPDFSIGWGGRFAVGLSTGGSMAGLAGLEIVTRSSGGLSKIGIMGSVVIAGDGWMVTPSAAKVMYHALCSDSDLMQPGGIANKTDGDPSEVNAQKFDIDGPKGFMGSIILKINFDDDSFYGKIGVGVATQSIAIQAVGAFLFAPDKWFIHLGEPPLASRIIVLLPGLPQIDGYIMLGHGVAELPAPEPNIFTKYPSQVNKRSSNISSGEVATGKGIAFGAALMVASSGSIPKNAPKPLLGYNIGARIGLDMMLMHYGNGAYCEGKEGQPIGINNWRAAGQVYAIGWLKGTAFGFDVLDIGLGAVLGGAAPNPTYGAGEVAVSFKVLVKKFNFSVGFSVGDDCAIVGGSAEVSNEEVFDGFYPNENQECVAKEIIPSISFTKPIENETQVEGFSGSYRQKVINYSLTEENGNSIAGSWAIDGASKIAFRPANPLPAGKRIIVKAQVQFQKLENGTWQAFSEGGSADTFKEYSFSTAKTAEEFIKDLSNIEKDTEKIAEEVKEDSRQQAQEINKYAEERANEIEENAKKVAELIYEKAEKKGDEILKKAEEANIPQEKKEEVKVIVTAAKETVKDLTSSALKKVHEITEKAKVDVRATTDFAVAQVDGVISTASGNVHNYKVSGESEIIRLNDELIQTKRNLEAQRRSEIKWWMGTKKKNIIKEDYRKRAYEAGQQAQRKMQEVVDRIKAQSEAEMDAAKKRSQEIMAAAKALAMQIMDKAEKDSKEVMADASRIADDIMAEAERQSNAIINGVENAKADLTAFSQIAQQKSSFYDEGDEATVQANISDNDVDENQIKADLIAEIERKRLAKEEEDIKAAEIQKQKEQEENDKKTAEQDTQNAEIQRQQEEWRRNDADRKKLEKDEEDRSQRNYQVEQQHIMALRLQDDFDAEQQRIETARQQQAYNLYLQQLEQQSFEEEQHQLQRQQAYEAQQQAYRQQQLEQEQNNNYGFSDIYVYEW